MEAELREIGLWTSVWIIIGGGVFGALVDSWVGATYQALYQNRQTQQFSERNESSNPDYEHVKGLTWLNNDTVNIIGIGAGVGFALLFLLLSSYL